MMIVASVRRLRALWWCALALLVGALPGVAALPALIPREVLCSGSQRTQVQLSRDGSSIAYLSPDARGVPQLCLRTLPTGAERVLTRFPQPCLDQFWFTYTGEHLLYTADRDGSEMNHLYLLEIKSATSRDLTPQPTASVLKLALARDAPWRVLVEAVLPQHQYRQVYAFDLQHPEAPPAVDTENPGYMIGWIPDSRLHVGAMVFGRKDGGRDVVIPRRVTVPARTPYLSPDGRSSTSSVERQLVEGYTTVYQWKRGEQGSLGGFINHDRDLLLASNRGAKAVRLLAIELTTKKQRVLAEDPAYDIADLYLQEGLVHAVAVNPDTLQWRAVIPAFVDHLEAMRGLHPGQLNIGSIRHDLVLLHFNSDTGPTEYFLYRLSTKEGTRLFADNDRLTGLPWAAMKPITVKARDKMTLHGYLTLPVGVEPNGLPLVLLVHGGPHARDTWGFDAQAQWLANRGYAVLQLNYRGSTGYGKAYLTAGFREWGGKMQTDLLDAVDWAVKEGIADPKKVAIMGGSYGGYAALAGVAFTPERFAAGIDLAGLTNLVRLAQEESNTRSTLGDRLVDTLGDAKKDAKRLTERSPIFAVDKITAPLLIAQGANDPRVPRADAEQMVNILRQAGKTVQYVCYTNEGHGLARLPNRLHFFALAEQFLARHLGGRCEPMGEIPGHTGKVVE